MGLREAAEQAWRAQQQSATESARTHLGVVLAPFDVSTLTVADVVVEPTFRLVVFTDGDVHVSVREYDAGATETFLVHNEDGRWVIDAPFSSLIGLHEVLPPLPPEPTIPMWEPGLAVTVGERYVYNGVTYEVLQAHTTQADWTPDKTPALWAVA